MPTTIFLYGGVMTTFEEVLKKCQDLLFEHTEKGQPGFLHIVTEDGIFEVRKGL